jgi:hypothetical protein
MSERPSIVVRLVKGFAILSEVGHFNVTSIVVLPLAVLLALRWSLGRAMRQSRHE